MILFCLVNGLCVSGHAQFATKNKKALAAFQQAQVSMAQRNYGRVLELTAEAQRLDPAFDEPYLLEGVCLKRMERWEEAIGRLQAGTVRARTATLLARLQFELAEAFLKTGSYEPAKAACEAYRAAGGADDKIQRWEATCAFALEEIARGDQPLWRPGRMPAALNTLPMQYFPVLTADESQIIFTVRGARGNFDDEDIYTAFQERPGVWTRPVPLSENLNTRLREGTASLSADGQWMVLARCGQKGCDLFESYRLGDDWSEAIPMANVNSPYWDSQPALSADGRLLFFASNRPGGRGAADIWLAVREADGTWGRPVNAGPAINTSDNEASPYLHPNGVDFFFASEGHLGMGGFDIFKSQWRGSEFKAVKNLGMPINDFRDQYALVVSAGGKKAFFTVFEGRHAGWLYESPLALELSAVPTVLRGDVKSAKSGNPLRAILRVTDLLTGQRVYDSRSDSLTGQFLTVLPGQSLYRVEVSHPGYLFHSGSFHVTENKDTLIEYPVRLVPIEAGAKVVLPNIYFDFDSHELRAESAQELEALRAFLESHPQLSVEISGHTDNTGSTARNQRLSELRAKSVVDYLRSQGISSGRLAGAGYGSTRPQAPNTTPQNQALNRRIEVRIR